MAELYGDDVYSPAQVAEKVKSVGVTKANLPLLSMIMLGILAGGFIGLGAMFYTVVVSDAGLTFALARVIGGVAFSLGLILVVIAGAELFTGNNLMVMAWVDRRIATPLLMRNLVVVYLANLVGAVGLGLLVAISGQWKMGHVGSAAVAIASAKVNLPFVEALGRGILCNVLVCLAVWLSMAARGVSGKVLAIVFPVTAFVACGFEHSVANMYFIPLGMMLGPHVGADPSLVEGLDLAGFAGNLVPVTLGNFVGGAGMVGLVYYVIYLRGHGPGRT